MNHRMNGVGTHGARRHERWAMLRGAAALAVLLGLLGIGGAELARTAAAFTDESRLGIETSAQFDAVLIGTDETVTGFGPDGLRAELAGDRPYVPGSTARAQFRVGNNSRAVPLDLRATIFGTGDLVPYARVTATLVHGDGSVETLLGDSDAPQDGAALEDGDAAGGTRIPVFALEPRGGSPLGDGQTWSGPGASAATLRISVHLLDSPELRNRDAGELGIRVELVAESGA